MGNKADTCRTRISPKHHAADWEQQQQSHSLAGQPGFTNNRIISPQTRSVAEVERRLSVVEELESVVSANLQRAVRLRQSILQKAFTGELV